MNQADGGGYKLLFILPIAPDTANVLFLDFEPGTLGERLAAMGIECRCGSLEGRGRPAADGARYDLIVAGSVPPGRRGTDSFAEAVGTLLSPGGHLVTVAANRFGYSRLAGVVGGTGSGRGGRARGAAGEGRSLRYLMRIMRGMGFTAVHAFSPVPDPSNPSAFISLRDPNTLEFLLGQFPDFITARSRPVKALLRALIRSGAYAHLLNHYVIVAGGRG